MEYIIPFITSVTIYIYSIIIYIYIHIHIPNHYQHCIHHILTIITHIFMETLIFQSTAVPKNGSLLPHGQLLCQLALGCGSAVFLAVEAMGKMGGFAPKWESISRSFLLGKKKKTLGFP